jgi:hypothetical protein
MLAFGIIVGVLLLWAVGEMILLMRSIPQGPFIGRNTHALSRIGVAALLLSGLFFAKCAPYFTPLTLACGFAFLVGGLFAFTLANLFRQAVSFKDENDLTI